MHAALMTFHGECAAAIDDDRLEEWPSFFTADCFYRVTTAPNHEQGLAAGLIFADSRQMLADRVLSLRRANVYEAQRYRHLLGLPRILRRDGDRLGAETGFAVLRTLRGGASEVFACGRYLDEFLLQPDGELKLRRRDVVCDSSRFDTLLAIPL